MKIKGDVTQGRGFECAAVVALAGNGGTAFILKRAIPPSDACVVKRFISELLAGVAEITLRLVLKQAQALEFKIAHQNATRNASDRKASQNADEI